MHVYVRWSLPLLSNSEQLAVTQIHNMSVVDKIRHYQRNLEKCYDNEDRILHCISKLYKLPVTVQHLQETGVGRTVNSLRKYDGNVGDAAKALVFKWKVMVADEYSSDGEEDEACIPDVPEDHSDNYTSPKLENTEENMSSLADQSSESKHTHKHKETKSEPFTKHSTMHLSKLKVEEEKHEKHEKNKHSSKHHSRSDKKSKESKSSDNSLKIEEASSLAKYSHSKMDNSRKINDKITEDNEENNKKRKQDNSDSSKKEIKKRKLSDSKSDDEKSQLSISGKNDSHLKSSNVQMEVKIEMTDLADKQSVKQEAEEKPSSSSSSSKSKSKQPSTAKDSTEKQKHKNKEHTSHKKSHTKKDSNQSTNQHSSKELSKSQASSSSSKDHDKSKNRSQKKERKDDKNRDEKKKETKIRLMQDINGDEGIDCNSGASFAEALGMCTMPQSSKKRHTISPNLNSNKSIKIESPPLPINNRKTPVIKPEPECDESPNSLSLLASNVKLEPLSVDLVSTLPEISPNYKPLPYINPIHRKEEIKAFDEIIYVKNQRTKVYSGNKVGYTSVPTLYDMCIRVLIENIDALEFTGGVPFDILKPVLERATADQLFMLEHYNPYLMEDTDVLWQFHANREFKKNVRQEMESWREMYMRCLDEREAKLKTLTANIKQSIDKSVPVRSTKLAYVDNIVKPPRNILKKQAKYGTANAVPATVSSVKKKLAVGGGATNNATNIAVPAPPMSRFKASTSNVKKTKAPLMAKALQLIKGRYKR